MIQSANSGLKDIWSWDLEDKWGDLKNVELVGMVASFRWSWIWGGARELVAPSLENDENDTRKGHVWLSRRRTIRIARYLQTVQTMTEEVVKGG